METIEQEIALTMKRCMVCAESFISTGNHHLYCPNCSKAKKTNDKVERLYYTAREIADVLAMPSHTVQAYSRMIFNQKGKITRDRIEPIKRMTFLINQGFTTKGAIKQMNNEKVLLALNYQLS